MHIHEDDHFLIVADVCGIAWVIIGVIIGVDPIFMSIVLLGKLSEMFIRYKRYDIQNQLPMFSIKGGLYVR